MNQTSTAIPNRKDDFHKTIGFIGVLFQPNLKWLTSFTFLGVEQQLQQQLQRHRKLRQKATRNVTPHRFCCAWIKRRLMWRA